MSRRLLFILMSLVLFCFVGGCVSDGKKKEINLEQLSNIKKEAVSVEEKQVQVYKKANERSSIEQNVLEKKMTVSFYKEPLVKAISRLIKNFEFDEGVQINIPITFNADNKPVDEILQRILKPKGLGYVKKGNNGIIIIKQPIITFTAYNQPFGLVITTMLSGYSYSLKDGAEDELNTIVTADFDEAPLDIALDRLLAQIKLFWEKKTGFIISIKKKNRCLIYFFL